MYNIGWDSPGQFSQLKKPAAESIGRDMPFLPVGPGDLFEAGKSVYSLSLQIQDYMLEALYFTITYIYLSRAISNIKDLMILATNIML